ncbi:MAG TPA: type II toxin-antitoxin system CcdA family antitoxin [Rhizomicrobium sp.]
MPKKRRFEDPPRKFRGAQPVRHSGPIGPGPKPGRKQAVNVSVDAEILKLAKEMGVNLSKALEDALRRATQDERARRFYLEHKAAFDAYNAYAEKYGTLTEAFEREFGE